jgi:hypothetical protein
MSKPLLWRIPPELPPARIKRPPIPDDVPSDEMTPEEIERMLDEWEACADDGALEDLMGWEYEEASRKQEEEHREREQEREHVLCSATVYRGDHHRRVEVSLVRSAAARAVLQIRLDRLRRLVVRLSDDRDDDSIFLRVRNGPTIAVFDVCVPAGVLHTLDTDASKPRDPDDPLLGGADLNGSHGELSARAALDDKAASGLALWVWTPGKHRVVVRAPRNSSDCVEVRYSDSQTSQAVRPKFVEIAVPHDLLRRDGLPKTGRR